MRLDLEGDYLVSGGGLPVTYKGFRVGVHIGANSSRGSEHTVDGKQYPGEVRHRIHCFAISLILSYTMGVLFLRLLIFEQSYFFEIVTE